MGCVNNTTSKSVNAVTRQAFDLVGSIPAVLFLPKPKLVTLQRYAIA
jgi:hypothetical protein